MRTKILAFLLLALPLAAFAQNSSPVGTWTTIDDETGKAKSTVEIFEATDGTLSGRVNKVISSDQGENPVCKKCSGDRKNKPIEGMTILWGLKKDGDTWEDGKILDPAKGKVYSAKVTPIENGQKLEVRGFMGFSLLGRTQVWVRK